MKKLKIKNFEVIPIIQAGMGIGVSLSPLASAVAQEGCLGIISSAYLDKILKKRNGKYYNIYDAVYEEVSLAKAKGGVAGINIMVAIQKDYDDSVRGSIDAGADLIISGGGLPLHLPSIKDPGNTALVPIVSSARALELICKKWERVGYRPDAVVLEGPLAGGHLGFRFEELNLESNKLENLFPAVKKVALKHGDFPVIVAGGIYGRDNILDFLHMGADGVQMGTRFLMTVESSASPRFKQDILNAREGDIEPTRLSPCGMPFMATKASQKAIHRQQKPRCGPGLVQRKDVGGNFSICDAKDHPEPEKDPVCICQALLGAIGDSEYFLHTAGKIGEKIDAIKTVKDLIGELIGGTK